MTCVGPSYKTQAVLREYESTAGVVVRREGEAERTEGVERKTGQVGELDKQTNYPSAAMRHRKGVNLVEMFLDLVCRLLPSK